MVNGTRARSTDWVNVNALGIADDNDDNKTSAGATDRNDTIKHDGNDGTMKR